MAGLDDEVFIKATRRKAALDRGDDKMPATPKSAYAAPVEKRNVLQRLRSMLGGREEGAPGNAQIKDRLEAERAEGVTRRSGPSTIDPNKAGN